MAYEHKSNSGSLFKNTKKQSDTHADYRGDASIECPHCGKGFLSWLDAWINEGAKGKYFGIKFKAKDAKPAQFTKPESGPQRARPSLKDEMEDEIPF